MSWIDGDRTRPSQDRPVVVHAGPREEGDVQGVIGVVVRDDDVGDVLGRQAVAA
jgi:hypothetical protein